MRLRQEILEHQPSFTLLSGRSSKEERFPWEEEAEIAKFSAQRFPFKSMPT